MSQASQFRSSITFWMDLRVVLHNVHQQLMIQLFFKATCKRLGKAVGIKNRNQYYERGLGTWIENMALKSIVFKVGLERSNISHIT